MKSVFLLICVFGCQNLWAEASDNRSMPALNAILSQTKSCNSRLVIRYQSLSTQQLQQACDQLATREDEFHRLFKTKGKPVKHDLNNELRVNVYASKDSYAKFATSHFDIPTDNGGMYLEGLPDIQGNKAEFITYVKKDIIWNLSHEYIHYLDGRFNIYGDFCLSLHDSHSPPENCPKPAPLYPHTVWWSEGIAEYIDKGNDNPRAFKSISTSKNKYLLSELFNTSYEANGGSSRVYSWGYFAARYMMENQRDKVEQMLTFLRAGDLPRYQALLVSWGTALDKDFDNWLAETLAANKKSIDDLGI